MSELISGENIYLKSGRTVRGPLSLKRLIQLSDTDRLTKSDLISVDRVSWVQAGLVPELFEPEAIVVHEAQWFYKQDGTQCGPYTESEIAELAANGKLLPTDRVWYEGMKTWQAAHKVREIRGNFNPAILPVGNSSWATVGIVSVVALMLVAVIALQRNSETSATVAASGASGASTGSGHEVTSVSCPDCQGGAVEADCTACGGFGFIRCTYSRPGMFLGVRCEGGNLIDNGGNFSGVCPECNKKGETRCEVCKSRGKIEFECRTCGGSGSIIK